MIEGFLVLVAAAATLASAAGFVWYFWLSGPQAPVEAGAPATATEARPATPPRADAPPTPARTVATTSYVLRGDAPLLRLPDASAEAKRTLRKGQRVERVGQIENWILVRLGGPGDAATTGWVELRHVEPAGN